MTMTLPTVDRLNVLVSNQTQLAAGRQAWTQFEKWVTLPFTYSELSFDVYRDSASSAYAEMQVRDGVASIKVTRKCLNDRSLERHLTLLHESLHIASFVGPLWEMYEAVKQLCETYRHVPGIAHWLGHYLYEVDAELALTKQYPEHARDRAAYYVTVQKQVRLQEREKNGWYTRVSADDPVRPYYVLGDRLCAELAGVLANDENVEIALCASLEHPPRESVDAIETLRRMLSPKSNNYADLPQWGFARYEAVLRHIIDKVQRRRND